MKTIRITVSGRVQGVYFRAETKAKAKLTGLKGTVRNLDNGDVEIIASGSDQQLQDLLQWAADGPPGASVEKILTTDMPLQTFDEFSIMRD